MSSSDEIPDGLSHITFEAPDDPEAHNTVTDFVDYTEYFPSDLIRSLTLIRNLDERYKDATLQVHELTTTLGNLPNLPAADRPSPTDLRANISKALQQAIIYREAACAEANRLSETTRRNASRLTLIRKKLQAMPLPPSRDPTPLPVSPQATRSRKGDAEKALKLTLHVANQKTLKHRRVLVPGEVLPPPGPEDEVFTQTEGSSVEDADELGDVLAEAAKPGRRSLKLKVPKAPRNPKVRKIPKAVFSNPRPSGSFGTNVHSQVAGISTSNALALLTPPPADAKPGSRFKPWFKLTDYEMATLRKSMKKNAIWTPSETMIRRVLAQTNRGPENYEQARAHAEETGEPLIDEDPMDPNQTILLPGEIMPNLPSGQAQSLENRGMRLNVAKKEKARQVKEQLEKEAAEAAAIVAEAEAALKKQKKEKLSRKEQLARERAQAKELESANRRIGQIGQDFKDLFSTSSTPLHESITTHPPVTTRKETKASKKRKRETDIAPVVNETPVKDTPGPKKLKINHPAIAPKPAPKQKENVSPAKTTTVTTTTTVPLAPAGPSPTRTTRRQATPGPATISTEIKIPAPVLPTAAQSRPRRTSGGSKATGEVESGTTLPDIKEDKGETTKERDLRPRSRGSMTGKAASAEPPSKPQRELREKRRASVVDAHAASDPTAFAFAEPRATRASRRPPPGFVTDEADGKGKVSVGKRKAAPRKRGTAGGIDGKGKKEEMGTESADEEVDADETRYCLCGAVSWGTMVACENEQVCLIITNVLTKLIIRTVRQRMVSSRLRQSLGSTDVAPKVVLP